MASHPDRGWSSGCAAWSVTSLGLLVHRSNLLLGLIFIDLTTCHILGGALREQVHHRRGRPGHRQPVVGDLARSPSLGLCMNRFPGGHPGGALQVLGQGLPLPLDLSLWSGVIAPLAARGSAQYSSFIPESMSSLSLVMVWYLNVFYQELKPLCIFGRDIAQCLNHFLHWS